MRIPKRSIWVIGDYRNYFQNRVTLQLLAKANDLAPKIGAEVSAVLFGQDLDAYVAEYIAHGAEKVYVVEDPILKDYSVETYSALMQQLARKYEPEIVLVGATSFGKELGDAPQAQQPGHHRHHAGHQGQRSRHDNELFRAGRSQPANDRGGHNGDGSL